MRCRVLQFFGLSEPIRKVWILLIDQDMTMRSSAQIHSVYLTEGEACKEFLRLKKLYPTWNPDYKIKEYAVS